MNEDKQEKKKRIANKIVMICSVLFVILMIGQYVVRFIDGNEKKRPWDKAAKEEVINRCSKLFANDEDTLVVKKICNCYLEEVIKNKHSYYEYKYYISKEKKTYLDSCVEKQSFL